MAVSPNSLSCLGKGYQVDSCLHCAKFTKQARRNRPASLRSNLLEVSICLSVFQSPGSWVMPPAPMRGDLAVTAASSTSVAKKHKSDKSLLSLLGLSLDALKLKKFKSTLALEPTALCLHITA